MNYQSIKNLTLTAMFLAVGLLLPFLTGQIPQIGNMLLPMHMAIPLPLPMFRLLVWMARKFPML